MRETTRLWGAVGAAGVLCSLLLIPLTSDISYLGMSWVMILVIVAVAVTAEWLHLSRSMAMLGQLVMMVGLTGTLAQSWGSPTVPWYLRLVRLLGQGYDHIRTQSAPMDADPGTRLLFVILIGLLVWLAGVLADALDKPAFSLAPLLTIYLVPALALREDMAWWSFVAVAVGYCGILYADARNGEARWARGLSIDTAGGRIGGGAWRMASMVTVGALALSLVVGTVLPIGATRYFGSARPNGSGPIELTDPQLDLRRNLEQPDSRTVLTYTTSKADGVYLRMTTLPVLSADGWGMSEIELRDGAIGAVPGVATMPDGARRDTQVTIDDLRSMYLPVPYAPRATSAQGEWAWDPGSLTIVATGADRNRATSGLSYSVESWDIAPDGGALSTARVGTPDVPQTTTDVPQDVPRSILDLTYTITDRESTPALKAAAIQAYLRSDLFSYSLQGSSGGSNFEAIETFLTDTRSGYCVQFAGSMALMARIVGIPSRVAVGFLPGTKSGSTWSVSSHDMHAWPELYFEGQGWVRFEPTPAVAVPPAWTIESTEQPTTSPTSQAEPTIAPTTEPTLEATDQPTVDPGTAQEATGLDWGRIGWTGLALLVLLVLAVTPRLVRSRLSRRRIAPEPGLDGRARIELGWHEIRDTWRDLGHTWPAGSPRVIAAAVDERLGSGPASQALARVEAQVEQARYADHAPESLDGYGEDIAAVRSGLLTAAPRERRLLATWYPASLATAVASWVTTVVKRPRGPKPPAPSAPTSPDTTSFARPGTPSL